MTRFTLQMYGNNFLSLLRFEIINKLLNILRDEFLITYCLQIMSQKQIIWLKFSADF